MVVLRVKKFHVCIEPSLFNDAFFSCLYFVASNSKMIREQCIGNDGE